MTAMDRSALEDDLQSILQSLQAKASRLPESERQPILVDLQRFERALQAKESLAAPTGPAYSTPSGLHRLDRAEERYRVLFNSMDTGYCTIEVLFDPAGYPHDYRFLEANPAFIQQTGLQDAVGRRIKELVPGQEQHWFDRYGRVALTGESMRFINEAKGLGRWFEVYAFRVGRPEDHTVAVLFYDITERQRTETALQVAARRDAYRVQLTDALRPLDDPAEVKRAANRLLAERLDAARVTYVDVDEAANTWFVESDYGKTGMVSLDGQHNFSDFGVYFVAAMRAGQPLVAENCAEIPDLSRHEQDSYRAIQCAAYIAVPLVKDGRFVAYLAVNHDQPRAWTAEEVELVEETAERTWAAVERARAESSLRQSEARLAAVFETLPVGVGLIDPQGKLVLSNQEMRRFLPSGTLPARDDSRFGRWHGRHPDGRRVERGDYPGMRALRGERILPAVEFLYFQDDGSEIWTSIAALPLFDTRDQVTGAIAVITDIDATKRTTEALRQSEERFRSSIDSLNEAFMILSAVREEGIIVDFCWDYMNSATCRLYGRGQDQILDRTIRELFPEQAELGLVARYAQVVETGLPMQEQVRYENDGQAGPLIRGDFDLRACKFGDGIIVTANDITEQVRREAERQKALQDREIHHRLTEQREMERQSIARDIHDGPIQTLSGMAFHVQFLKGGYNDPALLLELDQLSLSVKGAVQELRQVMNELRPPSVIRFGLSKAILLHADYLREHYPQVTWELNLNDDERVLSEQSCLALYRIYQEAVNNIIRHAEARNAWIRYRVEPGQVTLEVRDDGRGFSEQFDIAGLTQNKHFGLAGITERAEAINAVLEIDTRPGQGTAIRVRVPTGKEE